MRGSILKRFEELVDIGKSLPKAAHSVEWGAKVTKWRLSCLNLLERTFGKTSVHYREFLSYKDYTIPARVPYGLACMESAKEEIEKGFLYKIEHLVSADFFDSILEHAGFLLSKGHKDPAAILGRVTIEKTLKQIADRENVALPDKVKLSKVNEILWKKQAYEKITWRLIQGYIDLGNFAAHGDFDKYDDDAVKEMLSWIKRRLVNL